MLFVIRVNLLHPWPALFLCGLLLSLWCFTIFVKHYFQVSFNLKVNLSMVKTPQNIVTEPRYIALFITMWYCSKDFFLSQSKIKGESRIVAKKIVFRLRFSLSWPPFFGVFLLFLAADLEQTFCPGTINLHVYKMVDTVHENRTC